MLSLHSQDTFGSKLRRVIGAEGSIFYVAPISSSIRRNFGDPTLRPHLNFEPRLSGPIQDLLDGEYLGVQSHPAYRQPMATTSKGTRLWLGEPASGKDGDILPHLWYRASNGQTYGRGAKVQRQNGRLHVTGGQVDFPLETLSPVREAIFSDGVKVSERHPLRDTAGDRPVFFAYIQIFLDDLSGNKSKKWGGLHALSFQLANLPSTLLAEERSIYHYSVSDDASPLELAAAFANELKLHFSEPIPVWDVELQCDCLVYLRPVCLLGDNPMQAILCSNIGMAAGKSCRECHWGGKNAWKESGEGVRAALEPGEPRSAEDAITTLLMQLAHARDDQTSAYHQSRTDTGYADAFTHSAALSLLESNDIFRGKAPSHPSTPRPPLTEGQVRQRIKQLHEEFYDGQCYNPLLDLSDSIGWDVTQSSPVEVLHSLLLRPAKYLLKATKRLLKADQLDHLQLTLECLNTDGLQCGSGIRAAYFIRHADSLLGKELKICVQVMPMALGILKEQGRCESKLWMAWVALGRLSRAVYAKEIPREGLDDHLVELDAALVAFYGAYVYLLPFDLLYKPKLHLLSHLCDHVRSFGTASMFHTERYEANNTIIRNVSILTNRTAPSLDIMKRLELQAMLRFIVAGGEQYDATKKTVLKPGDRIRNIKWQNATIGLLRKWGLISDKERSQERSGFLQVTASVKPVIVSAGVLKVSEREFQRLGRTARDGLWSPAKSIVSAANDVCKPGAFVLLDDGENKLSVGQIDSLWATSGEEGIVVATLFKQRGWSSDYAAHRIKSSKEKLLFSSSDVVQLLNVQHDCIAARCKIDAQGGRHLTNREVSAITKPKLKHGDLQAFIINPHLLRTLPSKYAGRGLDADFPEADRDSIATRVSKQIKVVRQTRRRRRQPSQDADATSQGEDDDDNFSSTDDEDRMRT